MKKLNQIVRIRLVRQKKIVFSMIITLSIKINKNRNNLKLIVLIKQALK